MKHLIAAVALCLALPAHAQDETETETALSQAMSSQGYVPVSLMYEPFQICEDLLKDFGDGESMSRLGMEYCGIVLFSAVSTAMEFRVGGVPPSIPFEERQNELLIQQVAALRTQLAGLQALLDDAEARDAAKSVQLQSLGSDLNTALARVAAEQRRRAKSEANECLCADAAD
jgi:chemotaxis protein MotB